ncbi:hypothetical protein DVH24_004709 [Malus domestica]|uniref:Uncharacterized protein n=1 Tax=Malus domestica TaxID=3750 RepID=A0A498IF91_MALDO|nr:hypothetical protein DVH24_004709 [Malus domestica]
MIICDANIRGGQTGRGIVDWGRPVPKIVERKRSEPGHVSINNRNHSQSQTLPRLQLLDSHTHSAHCHCDQHNSTTSSITITITLSPLELQLSDSHNAHRCRDQHNNTTSAVATTIIILSSPLRTLLPAIIPLKFRVQEKGIFFIAIDVNKPFQIKDTLMLFCIR